jgi:two-component system KDP operon response regulator KdpE
VTRVLIVDDEPQLLRALRINLTARGYEVLTAANGAQAMESARSGHPDIVVLDLGLPDVDGVEVIADLRRWTPLPIVVLSGRTDGHDKVGALDAGADDYVTKPFSVDELLARIRAVTRRRAPDEPQTEVHIGQYVVDLANHAIHERDDPARTVRLTKTEWQLLEIFSRNPGKLISQRHLLEEVWGPTYVNETHYLRQYLNQLRRKLEPDPSRPRHLLTEPGMGYRFQP